ncbi:MAG: 30S ribosomal protein S16 [Armatimonadetes bacterium]|nr:30S ribosomal protein S16 [Armatimonadota bacterium]
MVKIRLERQGRKHRPFYRIVVADERKRQKGRTIECIGTYDPVSKKQFLTLESERALYWLLVGA